MASIVSTTGPKSRLVEQARRSDSHVAQEMVRANWRPSLLLQDTTGTQTLIIGCIIYALTPTQLCMALFVRVCVCVCVCTIPPALVSVAGSLLVVWAGLARPCREGRTR